jgi:hypothetical protein
VFVFWGFSSTLFGFVNYSFCYLCCELLLGVVWVFALGVWFGYLLWGCGLGMCSGGVVWVVDLGVWFWYLLWGCGLDICSGGVVWVVALGVWFGYLLWGCGLGSCSGGAVWVFALGVWFGYLLWGCGLEDDQAMFTGKMFVYIKCVRFIGTFPCC